MLKQLSVSLRNFSAIRIGGLADTVYFPEDLSELVGLLADNPRAPVIGGGTNVFLGSLPALICVKKLDGVKETPEGIEAECGALLEKLFDFAAGVPATVGGGVRMNFGAFGREIKDFLVSAQVWDAEHGARILTADELRLGYRAAGFAGIVLSALFKQKQLEKRAEYLQQRRAKMPWGQPNIGSIFKNPAGLSAGQLIEAAGLKGYTYKDLQISPRHANIIVNNGAASAEDLLFLLEHIKQAVWQKSGIMLELEIKYINIFL